MKNEKSFTVNLQKEVICARIEIERLKSVLYSYIKRDMSEGKLNEILDIARENTDKFIKDEYGVNVSDYEK